MTKFYLTENRENGKNYLNFLDEAGGVMWTIEAPEKHRKIFRHELIGRAIDTIYHFLRLKRKGVEDIDGNTTKEDTVIFIDETNSEIRKLVINLPKE